MKSYNLGKVFFLILLALISSSCAQPKLTEISQTDEVSINYQFIGKPGTTKKYRTDLSSLPDIPPVPNGFRLIGDASYLIKADLIPYGETVLTFKVPSVTNEEFNKVRILRLFTTDISPRGSEWIDCTLAEESLKMDLSERTSEEERKRLFRFLPNAPARSVSCNTDEFEAENYYVATIQVQPDPKVPFTSIIPKLERAEYTKDKRGNYLISFKNAGSVRAAEVIIYSHFDNRSAVLAIQPSQGRCQKAKLGSDEGSRVCYLGSLDPGAKAEIAFTSEPSSMEREVSALDGNKGWVIWGFIKANPSDMDWPANRFTFRPLN